MYLNTLTDNEGARKSRKRVGRGLGSGKGKTAGKGTKGQKARTGVAINAFEGGQMPIHRRLPKRGFYSDKQAYQVVNTGDLNTLLNNNVLQASQVITKEVLHSLGMIRKKEQPVKLLAKGDLQYSISIEVDRASQKAREFVENKGGKVLVKN